MKASLKHDGLVKIPQTHSSHGKTRNLSQLRQDVRPYRRMKRKSLPTGKEKTETSGTDRSLPAKENIVKLIFQNRLSGTIEKIPCLTQDKGR